MYFGVPRKKAAFPPERGRDGGFCLKLFEGLNVYPEPLLNYSKAFGFFRFSSTYRRFQKKIQVFGLVCR
jgi:hypothetical protein